MTPERRAIILSGGCGYPMPGPHSEIYCARPKSHGEFHMAYRVECPWCSGWVLPDGTGSEEPAQAEGGAVLHTSCLEALTGEWVGARAMSVERNGYEGAAA